MASAVARCLRFTFDRPMWRSLPSSRSSTSAPIDSSKGTFGSGACSWYSSMVSTRSRRKLASHTRRRYSGRPSGGSSGAVNGSPGTTPALVDDARDEAALGRDEHVVGIRDERLGDDLFTRPVAVDVGGVDELHSEVHRAPHQLRRRLTRTHHPHRAETQTRHLAVADHDRPGARCGTHQVQRRSRWNKGET